MNICFFFNNREAIKRVLNGFFNVFGRFLTRGGQYISMNLIDANRYKQKNQTLTPGENDHVKSNQGESDNNQGNGYN